VRLTCENDNGLGAYHEKAWDYIVAHGADVERSLRRKLWRECFRSYQEFVKEVDPRDCGWLAIKNAQPWDREESLDAQVELISIEWVDDGFDEVGFSIYEFGVGWDEEHGASILMHKTGVLAASVGLDFADRGPALVPHAKYIQLHDFSDGDLRIE